MPSSNAFGASKLPAVVQRPLQVVHHGQEFFDEVLVGELEQFRPFPLLALFQIFHIRGQPEQAGIVLFGFLGLFLQLLAATPPGPPNFPGTYGGTSGAVFSSWDGESCDPLVKKSDLDKVIKPFLLVILPTT